MSRDDFLNGLIGTPWLAGGDGTNGGFDCYHLAAHVQVILAGKTLPAIEVPEKPTWHWILHSIEQNPERKNWREVPCDPMGIVRAKDVSPVLMARMDRPAHIGTWLVPECRVLHADPRMGVVFEDVATLRVKGWTRLRFYEPI